ncbi:hypothetical protein EI94DRAFT_1611695, partial [Lactarius quietus]
HNVKTMDIYDIKMKQLPSHAEILLELTEKEISNSSRKRYVAWIGSRLKLQGAQ